MDEIKVQVVKYPDRANLVLRFTDPITGRHKTRSARTESMRDAEREAGRWQDELRDGKYIDPRKTTWKAFRERYENEVLTGLAKSTERKVFGVFESVETIIGPMRLADLNAECISRLQSKLRENGRAEATIKSHMAHLKAALRWAVSIGLLAKPPAITMPKRAKGGEFMRGRPITLEEFERMLKTTRSIVGRTAAKSWRRYLRGLWLSGLRIGESLTLTWDGDSGLRVDLQPGEHPMLRIPAEAEKGHRDRLLPMAPEFAEFLQRTPEGQRTGFVFNPQPRRTKRMKRPSVVTVIRLMGEIGERAGVKVKVEGGKVKFASAHDLRRSFGQRWASRVMPQVLMELMRHESIETTMRYYVGRNAQTTAAVLWEAHESNKRGNTRQNRQRATETESPQERERQEV